MTQKAISELYDCSIDNVSLHLKNIYKTLELDKNSTIEEFSIVQKEGNRQVSRKIKYYNLDAVISVGYRVNSDRAIQFRRWLTRVLKDEYVWLKEIDKFSLTNVIYNLDNAYNKFFKEHGGFPKYKSK